MTDTPTGPATPAVANPEAPNPQLPTVQRLRIRYTKRDRLRFTSHRDFGRAFERAVRRAGVPIAFSSGYSPHPKISYANASPTGAASEAEYLEIGLTRPLDPADVRSALDASLPRGLDVVDVVQAGTGSLADRLQASRWRLALPGADPVAVSAAVVTFLDAVEIPIERMTKKGLRTFDCRAATLALTASAADGGAAVEVVLRHEVPSIRPDDVLNGLRSVAGLDTGAAPVATRLEQGPLADDGVTIGDPLGPDRT